MRKRKYQGYGSLAEAGDAIQLAAGAVNPALYPGIIPLISGIDNRAADALLKKADFADQKSMPHIPLYLGAALLSSLGLAGARKWAINEGRNTPPLGTENWKDLVGSIGGSAPMLIGSQGRDNAFYYKPRNEIDAVRFLNYAGHRYNNLEDLTVWGEHRDPYSARMAKVKRLMRWGAIQADKDAGAPTLAHEAGHSKIEETPGFLRFLQRKVYPHQGWISPLAGAGSMAAGLASGSTLGGGLLGTGIGLLTGLGTIGPASCPAP